MSQTPAPGPLCWPEKIQVPYRGSVLLSQPQLNKGTAFSAEERRRFGLEGLLPAHISSIDQQLQRAYEHLQHKPDDLEKYIGLVGLQDRNQTLFYRLLVEHLPQLMPIVYTPTVGRACQQYSHIYRRPRGLWLTPRHRGRIAKVLANAPVGPIRLIVVTDNQRILGLGDLGAGGIGIPIGKLALYTAAAGIHPTFCLPISLDVGTDNADLLNDPLYLGWRRPRLRGQEYEDFIEEFVQAVQTVFPQALLQWEDFKKHNAFLLLQRYRDRLASFNDDIQGTAAVGLAAVLSGARKTGLPITRQRLLIVGAGAAGIGIARQVRSLLQRHGLREPALFEALCLMDSGGLLHEGRTIDESAKRPFAWQVELARRAGLPLDRPDDLVAVVQALRPTVLIGTTGQPGLFNRAVVQAMARSADQPIILPFSNPNSRSEAWPEDLVEWTDGRAVVATGSPFPAVRYGGRTIEIGQANNVFIFPGVGLGVLVSGAQRLTEAMFTAAAEALADQVTDQEMARGLLFPAIDRLRQVERTVARAVIDSACSQGLCPASRQCPWESWLDRSMWWPDYPHLEPV